MAMPLLRTFDSRNDRVETVARKVRALSRFDVLEAEGSPAGAAVRNVIAQVRSRGDAALCEYTKRFDKADLTAEQLRVPADRLEAAARDLDPALKQAIRKAIDNVRAYQAQILTAVDRTCERPGVRLELRIRPLRRVGVYVPAGSAPLPSTVIHCVVPAQAAGVAQIVLTSPPRSSGDVDPTILAVAHMLGIDEVYRLGGAQAIAAMALGTATIHPVDKVVGPGNIYAQLAKKMLYGVVDVDGFAGPSEVLVIADGSANPAFIAADLLAQAEHNPGQAVLVTPTADLIPQVEAALELHLSNLAAVEGARKCLRDFAAVILVRDLAQAAAFAEAYAPEHLQIETADPRQVAERIRSAGAVFLGHWTPESFGDYVAGPSHVLPTGGTARFFSGLSVYDFLRRSAWIEYDRTGLRAEGDATVRIADAEGLAGHALAVTVRMEQAGNG
jgi:histidinol dehydrogenase